MPVFRDRAGTLLEVASKDKEAADAVSANSTISVSIGSFLNSSIVLFSRIAMDFAICATQKGTLDRAAAVSLKHQELTTHYSGLSAELPSKVPGRKAGTSCERLLPAGPKCAAFR